jgi:hypothetical protein
MRSKILGLLIAVVVAAAVVGGVHLASEIGDGTTTARGQADGSIEVSAPVVATAEGSPSGGTTPGEIPTCPPATPTPIPGEPEPPREPAPWPCIPPDQPRPPDDAPYLTPAPRPEPEPCVGCIDLSEPVPYEIPMKVAGKTIHLPVGSTHYEWIVEYPVGVVPSGPTMMDVIERGHSKVVIDSHTGQIIEWNVVPADEEDFRSLIFEPLQ